MQELERINTILATNEIPDFWIQEFNGINLILRGSFDFFYYHNLEVEFKEVSYISLPVEFHFPFFRLADTKEINLISNLVFLSPEDIVYCLEAETSCSINRIPFYLVARSITIRKETVFYYKKENSQ